MDIHSNEGIVSDQSRITPSHHYISPLWVNESRRQKILIQDEAISQRAVAVAVICARCASRRFMFGQKHLRTVYNAADETSRREHERISSSSTRKAENELGCEREHQQQQPRARR
jgi:hypothetical protein